MMMIKHTFQVPKYWMISPRQAPSPPRANGTTNPPEIFHFFPFFRLATPPPLKIPYACRKIVDMRQPQVKKLKKKSYLRKISQRLVVDL